MSKMSFIQELDEYHSESDVLPSHKLEISFNAEGAFIDDVVDQFECFLRACGYVFDGKLTISDKEEKSSKEA